MSPLIVPFAAQSKRPQLGKWLDTFGGAYSKAVLAATLATLLLLPCCGIPWLDTAAQRGAVYRAMGVLTVASPCALVVVPCAYIAAIACISFRWAGQSPGAGSLLSSCTGKDVQPLCSLGSAVSAVHTAPHTRDAG